MNQRNYFNEFSEFPSKEKLHSPFNLSVDQQRFQETNALFSFQN